MKTLYILLLFIVVAFPAISQEQCRNFSPMAYMVNTPNQTTVICRQDYVVVYDTICKIPLITFENLIRTELDGVVPRASSFKVDPTIPVDQSAMLSDYYRSGYDRGHMVPAADMRETQASMQETFFLSNIIPQNPAANRGVWKYIEEYSRSVVTLRGDRETFIITGVILSDSPSTIGDGVCIPDAMFKIIVGDEIEGFLVDNVKPKTSQIIYYRSSLREIMQRSNIIFFN